MPHSSIRPKLFWVGPNFFGMGQIVKFSKYENLFLVQSKIFGPNQITLDQL